MSGVPGALVTLCWSILWLGTDAAVVVTLYIVVHKEKLLVEWLRLLPFVGFLVTARASLEMAAIFSSFSSSLLRAQLSHRFKSFGLTFQSQVLIWQAHQIVWLVYYLHIGLLVFSGSLWGLELEVSGLCWHEAVRRLRGRWPHADLWLESGHLLFQYPVLSVELLHLGR